jgi:molybdopterin-guanine dinucleotide biosynthesis protein A
VARVLGVVLAGGTGRRLRAATPKALVPAGGVTLLDRALAALVPHCDDWVVVAPASVALPTPPARRVHDPEPGDGPLAALVAGLAARPYDVALALGVDFPFVSAALLRALLDSPAAAAVVPAPGGRTQPLVARYGAEALAPLAAALARGERALVPAVEALHPHVLDDAALAALPGGAGALLNVNTPADLAEAGARLARVGCA